MLDFIENKNYFNPCNGTRNNHAWIADISLDLAYRILDLTNENAGFQLSAWEPLVGWYIVQGSLKDYESAVDFAKEWYKKQKNFFKKVLDNSESL